VPDHRPEEQEELTGPRTSSRTCRVARAWERERLCTSQLQRQRRRRRWLDVLFLDLILGHGYRPSRSILSYLAVVLGFAVGYYLLDHGAPLCLTPQEAHLTSIVSFHRRGSFPTSINLANLTTPLVAAEAMCGLLIEITFSATFTQHFFAR
jgi:hypothetical protein